jgi:hypothetical protein
MRKISYLLTLCLALLASSAQAQHEHQPQTKAAPQIVGEYIETRSADVFTGPCYANSEVGLVGDTAILGWRVERGSWQGVSLDGLNVVAVVKAGATLGDSHENPYPAKSVLIVDAKATPEQRAALAAFARAQAGKLLDEVVRTEAAPITFEMDYHGEHIANARLKAGETVGVRTRMLTDKDHACGNVDGTFYPPLTATTHAMPAVAMTDEFSGEGLNTSWTLHDKRSAFVGHFAR